MSKWKSRVVRDYLKRSGKDEYVEAEFLEWLADKPDHEAYDAFCGQDAPRPSPDAITIKVGVTFND